MKVLDLFAGLGGWSAPFRERGHDVYRVDYDARFDVELVADIQQLQPADLPWKPDVILASPPCEGFSVMRIGQNWYHDGQPKSPTALQGIRLVNATVQLIHQLQPRYFVIENPRAKLRALSLLDHLERRTVTYCKYGERRMKPTDLWGGFPPSLQLRHPCVNGQPCHVSAPRGSRNGSQGMASADSAKIPYQLAAAICAAAERDILLS